MAACKGIVQRKKTEAAGTIVRNSDHTHKKRVYPVSTGPENLS